MGSNFYNRLGFLHPAISAIRLYPAISGYIRLYPAISGYIRLNG
jgi:hypothetical protein